MIVRLVYAEHPVANTPSEQHAWWVKFLLADVHTADGAHVNRPHHANPEVRQVNQKFFIYVLTALPSARNMSAGFSGSVVLEQNSTGVGFLSYRCTYNG